MVTNMRLLRVAKGLTLRQAAKGLGMHESWYCRIERGQAYVPPHLREKLAGFYGVPVNEICDPVTGWPVLVGR